jgi:hypothetical protein
MLHRLKETINDLEFSRRFIAVNYLSSTVEKFDESQKKVLDDDLFYSCYSYYLHDF